MLVVLECLMWRLEQLQHWSTHSLLRLSHHSSLQTTTWTPCTGGMCWRKEIFLILAAHLTILFLSSPPSKMYTRTLLSMLFGSPLSSGTNSSLNVESPTPPLMQILQQSWSVQKSSSWIQRQSFPPAIGSQESLAWHLSRNHSFSNFSRTSSQLKSVYTGLEKSSHHHVSSVMLKKIP